MTKIIRHSRGCIASVLNRKMKLLLVAAAIVTGGLQAQTQITKDTIRFGEEGQINGVGTWTCPAGVTSLTVECWGGGGAGGTILALPNAEGTNYRAKVLGGGGAGGSYAAVTIPNPTAGVYSYTVGIGGQGVAVGTAPDYFTDFAVSNGENTIFNNTLSEIIVKALGGAGGQSAKANNSSPGAIGLGGAKVETGNIGTTSFYGGAGGNAADGATTSSGGGGGSAGATSNGGDATNNTGGIAGTGGGIVGPNGSSTNAGNFGGGSGTAPGAGGAGSLSRAQLTTTLVSRGGGKGGNGQIIITYTGGTTTGLSAFKANAFVTVVGKSLLVNGEVNAVEVYNLQGKLINEQGKATHVNGLTNGIYIVKMHTPQGVKVQKVSIR